MLPCFSGYLLYLNFSWRAPHVFETHHYFSFLKFSNSPKPLVYLEIVNSINVLLFRTVFLMWCSSKGKTALVQESQLSPLCPLGVRTWQLARIEIPTDSNEALLCLTPRGWFPPHWLSVRWCRALGKDRYRTKACLGVSASDTVVPVAELSTWETLKWVESGVQAFLGDDLKFCSVWSISVRMPKGL